MSTPEILFLDAGEAPPPSQRDSDREIVRAVAVELQRHPGQWALLHPTTMTAVERHKEAVAGDLKCYIQPDNRREIWPLESCESHFDSEGNEWIRWHQETA